MPHLSPLSHMPTRRAIPRARNDPSTPVHPWTERSTALRCVLYSRGPTFRPLRAAIARLAALQMCAVKSSLPGSSALPLFQSSAVPCIAKIACNFACNLEGGNYWTIHILKVRVAARIPNCVAA